MAVLLRLCVFSMAKYVSAARIAMVDRADDSCQPEKWSQLRRVAAESKVWPSCTMANRSPSSQKVDRYE